jgi:ribosomal protein L11 methyltransferase
MNRARLWRLSVSTSPEAEDAVTALLQRSFGQPVTSYTEAATRETTVSIYLSVKPDWSRAMQTQLTSGLQRIRDNGLDVGPGRISLKPVRQQGWAESWKLHFKPVAFGSALLLKPSWSRQRGRKGQVVIVLDPGLSFGTGRHPTTAFCLRQLVALRQRGKRQSCLDVGTGSGILAIAAAKLGYTPVEAFDCDPDAVRVARANARRNGVAARIRFRRQDLAALSRRRVTQYSVVCANLVSSLLLAQRERLLSRLRPGGTLLVAGILKGEFSPLQSAFAASGLRLVASQTQNEWRSGAFRASASPWRGCTPRIFE